MEDIVRAFELFDRDDRVRVVIMTAETTAPAYCSGVSQRYPLYRNGYQTFLVKADISGGWDMLWDPESEKEGEHGSFSRLQSSIGSVLPTTNSP